MCMCCSGGADAHAVGGVDAVAEAQDRVVQAAAGPCACGAHAVAAAGGEEEVGRRQRVPLAAAVRARCSATIESQAR